jgi:hypothetical protein
MKTAGRRIIRVTLWVLAVLLVLIAVRAMYAFRDRTPGYSLSLSIDGGADPASIKELRAGFGRVKINPVLGDGSHPIWIAGFGQRRAATAVHDDLWAVACVIDDGRTRLGIVSLDSIGLFHDDVIRIRRAILPQSGITYAVVCATHNHSTPDLMGLWGPDYFHSGVDLRYREEVIAGAARAVDMAAASLQPARVRFRQVAVPSAGLVEDGRMPEVFDPDVRLMHFTRADGSTIGSLVTWADHPETLWSKNTELTADYCGYLRDALENGVVRSGQTLASGLGGIHLYINGAIGGLMTTSPDVTVRDPYSNEEFKSPSHAKARAVGLQLASRILRTLGDEGEVPVDRLGIGVRARTINVRIANWGYLLGQVLGLLDRGHVHYGYIRSEVAMLMLGEASIACVPGEIYPEVVNGGIENPRGADYAIAPVEVPPIRDLMPGKYKFVFGLASDEIGYMIPKSEWDQAAPYMYDSPEPMYGEINSCGPETAPTIHGALRELCRSPE